MTNPTVSNETGGWEAVSATCRTCGADIIWAETMAGKRAPIDAEPNPEGNVVLFDDGGPTRCMSLGGPILDKARADDETTLYTNHFATCPYAASHRS